MELETLERVEEYRFKRERLAKWTQLLNRIGGTAVRTGGIVLCFYFLHLTVKDLAGTKTELQLVLSAVANLGINKHLMILACLLSTGWGYGERRLRKRKVAELAERIKFFEQQFDSRRTSSNLDEDGTTNDD